MTTVATIALAIAVLVTALLYVAQRSNARLSGPDRAGAAIVYFMVAPFRWLALAVALGVAIDAGGFAWITLSTAAQAILVYIVHLATGVGSVIFLVVSGDRGAATPMRVACGLVSYLLPIVLVVYTGWAIDPAIVPWASPALMRWILLGALAVAAIAAATAALAASRAAAKRRAEAEAAPPDPFTERRLAELKATSPQAPLWQWLDFTGDNEPRAVREAALAAVAARPNLHAELAELLSGTWRTEALAHIRWHMTDSPPGLAIPVRDALLRVAQHMRDRLDQDETPYPGRFELETGQAVDLAERFHGPEADFRPVLAATRDALDRAGGRKVAPENRRRLDAWLRSDSRDPQ